MTIEAGLLVTPEIVFGEPIANTSSIVAFSEGFLLEAGNLVFADYYVASGSGNVYSEGEQLEPGALVFGDALVCGDILPKIFKSGLLLAITARPGLPSDTGVALVLGLYCEFSVNKRTAQTGEWITFSDETFGAPIVSWLWDFGDGRSSTKQNPIHYYLVTGAYNVRLTVESAGGDQARQYKQVYITIISVGSSVHYPDMELRSSSLLLEQVKKQYGDNSATENVLSDTGTPAPASAPSELARITDYTTRVARLINENVRKQYGAG